jgi:hypothetical protein
MSTSRKAEDNTQSYTKLPAFVHVKTVHFYLSTLEVVLEKIENHFTYAKGSGDDYEFVFVQGKVKRRVDCKTYNFVTEYGLLKLRLDG